MNQYLGFQCCMISKHLRTILSEPSRSLGVFAFVLAMLYCVHGGEHQMTSGYSRLESAYSQDMISVHISGIHFGSMSDVSASCPCSLQTFDTLFVPQQMSQIRMCFLSRG